MQRSHRLLSSSATLVALALPDASAAAPSMQPVMSAQIEAQIIDGCAADAKAKGQSHAVAVSGEAPPDDAGCAEAEIKAAGLASAPRRGN